MQTQALQLAKNYAETNKAERLSWGIVEFQVTDIKRTIAFWTQTLGLIVRGQYRHIVDSVELGTPSKTLFVFHSGAEIEVSPKHLGMYHVALGITDQKEFSRLLTRLIDLDVPFSPVDHLMTKSLYLHDPDGLEIEIAYETPERFGSFDTSQGISMFDIDGNPHNGRALLDIKAELVHAQNTDHEALLSDDAFLSHIHFKVAELDSAEQWFEKIGFAQNLNLPDIGIADMGAGSAYTHRVAMNTWSGPNLEPAPTNMARLLRYALKVNDPQLMQYVITANPQSGSAHGLQPSEAGLTGLDPTGTEVSLIPAF